MSVDSRLAHHGHVSYLEIPAADVKASAAFYEAVFGWKVDRRADDRASFDDGTGAVIGRWVTGAARSRDAGIVPYIYVDRIDDAVQRITIYGGSLIKAPYAEGDLWVATFRDPAGNLLGIWHAGSR